MKFRHFQWESDRCQSYQSKFWLARFRPVKPFFEHSSLSFTETLFAGQDSFCSENLFTLSLACTVWHNAWEAELSLSFTWNKPDHDTATEMPDKGTEPKPSQPSAKAETRAHSTSSSAASSTVYQLHKKKGQFHMQWRNFSWSLAEDDLAIRRICSSVV